MAVGHSSSDVKSGRGIDLNMGAQWTNGQFELRGSQIGARLQRLGHQLSLSPLSARAGRMADREGIGTNAALDISPRHRRRYGEPRPSTRRVSPYRGVAASVSQVVDEHLTRPSTPTGAAR